MLVDKISVRGASYFVGDQADALKVKIGDTLSIMASGGLMGSAVRELIGRMKAAGTQKWLFWLEDGGWKDDAGSNATEAAFLGGSV